MTLQDLMATGQFGNSDPVDTPSSETIDLMGSDLEAFVTQLQSMFKRSGDEMQPLVSEANRDEQMYAQQGYSAREVPFAGAFSITVPAASARVDKASSEIGSAWDRDGSPVFGATPLTPSMATLAPHVEAFIHQNISLANGTQQYRIGTHRAFKTGTSFLCSEIVSRPVNGMNTTSQFSPGETQDYENALVIRSVKQQDMFVLPSGLSDLKDAAFVGERFQMTRFRYEDAVADGFYQRPMTLDGAVDDIPSGYYNQEHGQMEEFRRLGLVDHSNTDIQDMAGIVDLVRAWMWFKPPSQPNERIKLWYTVFSAKDPNKIIRLKENPYTLLRQAPYVPMPAGMGDGTIWGNSWMKMLRNLQNLLDTLHMIHVESQKRAYSKFYLVREGSGIAEELERRQKAAKKQSGGENPNSGVNQQSVIARIMPDEWFVTDDPAGDIKDFGFTDMNPGFTYDENRILQYMSQATIDDMPTAGSVKSAFEMRQAASETAAKLKSYLKVLSSFSMKPHIEMVKAQMWEFMMPISQLSDYVRFLEYGDVSIPITMTDFFHGVSLDPAGTTTSADETVAVTTTASLMQEIVPVLMNIPGVVADVPAAVRELMKARVAALGYEKFDTLFGLTPPTAEEQQKAIMYLQVTKSLSTNQGIGQQQVMGGEMAGMMGGQMGSASMGGDGAAAMQTPMNLGQGGFKGDSQGGSAAGVSPEMQQLMGGPAGQGN